MKPGSLRLRLLAFGGAAILAALAVASVGLSFLFERHVVRTLAGDLEIHLRQILSAIELDQAGRPRLARQPSDPRFAEPLSGLYWQLSGRPDAIVRSRSLWDATLPMPADVLSAGEEHHHRVSGPAGSELLAVERTVFLTAGGARKPFRVIVAADVANITKARQSFMGDLILSLALLGLALAAATWAQIGLGLRPLARVRDAIAAVRAGKVSRIDMMVPNEVAPLVEEVNGLLMAQEEDLERARGLAADLAHGLKTPLSALASEVRSLRARGDRDIADRIEEIGETMRRHVERELARARIRGKRGFGTSSKTQLRVLADKLVSVQRRAAPGQRVSFEVDMPVEAEIAMDRADVAEVLGNLLENACRHARSVVRLSLAHGGRVVIEDDGPGIPAHLRDWVLERGRRLDERPDGAGLGLAITREILEAYGRNLTLETSTLGGLKVSF